MDVAESEDCLRQGGCEDAPTREGLPPGRLSSSRYALPFARTALKHGAQYHRARLGSRLLQPTPCTPTEPQAQRCTSGPAMGAATDLRLAALLMLLNPLKQDGGLAGLATLAARPVSTPGFGLCPASPSSRAMKSASAPILTPPSRLAATHRGQPARQRDGERRAASSPTRAPPVSKRPFVPSPPHGCC